MTRERAIEVLKAWDLNWSDSFTANEFEQAFNMAISTLSEKKGEWTYPKVETWANENGYVLVKESWYEKARDAIEGSKNQRQKGEWIPKERTDEFFVDIDIVCSKCGYVGVKEYAHGYELNEIDMKKVRDFTKELDMNFCTCCGAKMKGGE